MSCQPCGCDPEASHECERHLIMRQTRETYQPVVNTLAEFKQVVSELLETELESSAHYILKLSTLRKHL
jgi:hypothetical protein